MSNRNTRTSTPEPAPKLAPTKPEPASKPVSILGVTLGTKVNPAEKLPEGIRKAAHKAVAAFWEGWFAKNGAADRLAAVEKAREEFEEASRSLSGYIVGMACDAFRINGPDVAATSNLFGAMCDEGETYLKGTAAWNESATVQAKGAKSLSEAVPQWKVYKSQIKAGITAGVFGALLEVSEREGKPVTLYAINAAVKTAKGGGTPAGVTNIAGNGGKGSGNDSGAQNGPSVAKPGPKSTNAALDAIRAVLDGLYVTTAGDNRAEGILAQCLSEAVAQFHKRVKETPTESNAKLDAVNA